MAVRGLLLRRMRNVATRLISRYGAAYVYV